MRKINIELQSYNKRGKGLSQYVKTEEFPSIVYHGTLAFEIEDFEYIETSLIQFTMEQFVLTTSDAICDRLAACPSYKSSKAN